jgi:hypothetical protein
VTDVQHRRIIEASVGRIGDFRLWHSVLNPQNHGGSTAENLTWEVQKPPATQPR